MMDRKVQSHPSGIVATPYGLLAVYGIQADLLLVQDEVTVPGDDRYDGVTASMVFRLRRYGPNQHFVPDQGLDVPATSAYGSLCLTDTTTREAVGHPARSLLWEEIPKIVNAWLHPYEDCRFLKDAEKVEINNAIVKLDECIEVAEGILTDLQKKRQRQLELERMIGVAAGLRKLAKEQ